MQKLIYRMSVSLDGFIEGPGGDLNWSAPDAELHQHFNDLESTIDVQLYGRRLYENMTAFWPTADEDPTATKQVKEYARIWRAQPKIVFSTTLRHVEWNSRLVTENAEQEVRRLKEEPGKDLAVGGAGLAGSLMQWGLIDEYGLYIHPVLLGGGKPMFPALHEPISLELLETRLFGGGVTLLRYAAR